MAVSVSTDNATEEKRMIIGLVTSTEYIRGIIPYIDLEYFTNDYLRTVAEWSLSFFEEHDTAPGQHIEDIFKSKKRKLKPIKIELIGKLLKKLSNQFDNEGSQNVDYLIKTSELYFRRRELEITANNILIHLDKGRIEEAEKDLTRYNKVSVDLDQSIYINPGDKETRRKIYQKRQEREKDFFQLPGDLGAFLGNHKPGDVVGITAPAKRGKSFLLTNYNTQAVMSRIKTAMWSIEMTDTETISRSDKSIIPMVTESYQESGDYYYPIFDCVKNQNGTCGYRESKVIISEEDNPPKSLLRKHKVCTKCMHSRKNGREYQMTTFDNIIHRDADNPFTIEKKIKPYLNLLDRYSRLIVRPKYSLSYDLILHDLHQLETNHGFIPQILILDYIDILKLSSHKDDYRDEDARWKLMQELAGMFNCLVITATQSDKSGYTTKTLGATNQAGFYGKGRHVNLMVSINQEPEEKRKGIWRLGKMEGRDIRVDPEETCVVLQDLKTGQMHLDSYWSKKTNFKY